MDILDDMGASKLSAKVVLKVNYSFNTLIMLIIIKMPWHHCSNVLHVK